MNDLISRKELLESIEEVSIKGNVLDDDWVYRFVQEFPSIDAVSIVRCKNCKYWHREIYNGIEYFNFSSCDLNHHGDGRNFYCADAEGKEE